MPNLTSVGISSGVPNSGTGTVSTLDAVMALLGEVQSSPTSNTALDRLKAIATLLGGTLTVGNAGTFIVQAAQSGTWAISLPTGAATAAKQPTLGTAGSASTDVVTVQGIASGTPQPVSDGAGSLTVDNGGTFAVQATQAGTWIVSLPTGAATAAKQPTLGTAGSASTDVITVQGIASGTAQPVSGTLKTSFGTATAFTKTNANLAASVTAGWKSNAIDNTTTKALDALIGVELAAVNTAPAGTKSLYIYAYGLIEGTAYTGTGAAAIDGTEGTLTFPSVTTLPVVCRLISTIPYPVQNVAINAGPFSVAAAFGGILPDKWGIAMVNDTGMTLSVTNIFYQEITNTLG